MPLDVVISGRCVALDLARRSETKPHTNAVVLHVFCDASFKRTPFPRGGLGVVVNIWIPSEITNRRTSKACFIPPSRFDNNNLTEAIALAEGAHVTIDQIASLTSRSLIGATDEVEVVFWSDSQKVLSALDERPQLLSKKMEHLLDIIELKTRDLQNLGSNLSVQFRWCPEECVEPHQIADELSKKVRISGGKTPSKALALVNRFPHSTIKSILRQPLPVPSIHQSSSLAAETTTTAVDAASSGSEAPTVVEDDGPPNDDRDSLRSSPVPVRAPPPSPSQSAADIIVAFLLKRGSDSSRFFSIVTAAVKCLPAYQRRTMVVAIRQQKYANKRLRALGLNTPQSQAEGNEPANRSQTHLFNLVDIAALGLPSTYKDSVLAAIQAQKSMNQSLAQGEVMGQGYESESDEDSDVDDESRLQEAPHGTRMRAIWSRLDGVIRRI
ncbi:hypothetical protein diail_9290 [Diaporthe ilicicola]|nr:hypothetical protein diail_9290 [Diaporthe ilicicola]